MEKLYIKISGLSPLLMNNPENMMIGRTKLPTPEEEVRQSRYSMPDESLYVPSIALRKSILLGATGYKIGKFSLKSRLSAAIQLFEERFPISDERGENTSDYAIDRRRVVIRGAGIIRSRARVEPPWFVAGYFKVNSELLMDRYGIVQIDLLREIINVAGQVSGLLDFRPNRGGWFGQYELMDIEIQE